jgi:hypothetical protein
MARFRKRFRRARAFMRRRAGRSMGSGLKATDIMMAGAVYGFARPMVANMIPPLFEFGPIDSDNAIIGVAAYMGMKQKNKLVRAISAVALGGEIAQVTAKMTAGNTSSSSVQY